MIKGSIVSVNIGKAKKAHWDDRDVTTGIFKEPVFGRVKMGKLGLDGDEQADLTVHGGPLKTAYAYPSEHYAYWKRELAWKPGLEPETIQTGMSSKSETISKYQPRNRSPCGLMFLAHRASNS